MPTIFGAA
jgi:hypothetical protein